MRDIAIRVENLSKLYRLGKRERYRTLRDTLTDMFAAPFRRFRSGASRKTPNETIWALKDVSFDVKHGEVVGIIGGNGAGKSTLLKILSRITEPTEGTALIHGRVGSLLEVGTGFHSELSGRENIYLNGAILGMKRAEIQRKFDEIVAFAEVDKFIDTPVKHYSSGMYMRLAFAVAAHLDPDILLIDEVLAVGDRGFQKKCLGKMREVANGGRTVLFVSHNLTAVGTLCETALWVQRGEVAAFGPAPDILSKYLQPDGDAHVFDPSRFPNDPDFRLIEAYISQMDDRRGPFDPSQPVDIRLHYAVKRRVIGLRVGVDVLTTDGITLWRSFDDDLGSREELSRMPGNYMATCRLPANIFLSRQYLVSLSIGIHANRWITFQELQHTIEFLNVNGVGSAYADEKYRAGLLMLGLDWKTTMSADVPECCVQE